MPTECERHNATHVQQTQQQQQQEQQPELQQQQHVEKLAAAVGAHEQQQQQDTYDDAMELSKDLNGEMSTSQTSNTSSTGGSTNGHNGNSNGIGGRKTSITSPDPTAYVAKARVTRPTPPPPSYNPMQFVQIKPCNLYQTAQEQLKKAEEVKKIKEIKKEEPEDWQNNLDNWKSSRRKRVEHIIDRVVEVKKLELEEHDRSRRKSKTFSEMIEERGERGARGRTKLASLAVYNEDESNDFSDLGIGTSSASGKSSQSEDYDNNSVLSDNAELDKAIFEQNHKPNGPTAREYISSPGYDTSSSTAPGSSPDPCEYTYEGAIQDYKQRVSRATAGSAMPNFKLNNANGNGNASIKSSVSPLKESSAADGSNAETYPTRRGSKIEDRLIGFEVTSPSDSQEGVEKSKVDVPKIDISKRKEIFENQNANNNTTEPKSSLGGSGNAAVPRVTLRDRFKVDESVHAGNGEVHDSTLKREVKRLSGDITSIRDRMQSLEQQHNLVNSTSGNAKHNPGKLVDIPVPPLKDRLSSLHNAVTKEEIRKPPVVLVDARQLEIMKSEEETAKQRMKQLEQDKPSPQAIHNKQQSVKVTVVDRDDNGIHTADDNETLEQISEQEHQLNAAIAALALEEQQLAEAANAVNQIEAEFAELSSNPVNGITNKTTNEQPSELEFSIDEALELALAAIDKETKPISISNNNNTSSIQQTAITTTMYNQTATVAATSTTTKTTIHKHIVTDSNKPISNSKDTPNTTDEEKQSKCKEKLNQNVIIKNEECEVEVEMKDQLKQVNELEMNQEKDDADELAREALISLEPIYENISSASTFQVDTESIIIIPNTITNTTNSNNSNSNSKNNTNNKSNAKINQLINQNNQSVNSNNQNNNNKSNNQQLTNNSNKQNLIELTNAFASATSITAATTTTAVAIATKTDSDNIPITKATSTATAMIKVTPQKQQQQITHSEQTNTTTATEAASLETPLSATQSSHHLNTAKSDSVADEVPITEPEPYYQVPKSSEPYYDAPKHLRPVPLYENIEVFYNGLENATLANGGIGSFKMEPPKEKPPPPPIESPPLFDDVECFDNTDTWSSDNTYETISSRLPHNGLAGEHPSPPIKRMNSTKRIKKELRNKRSSFLGIDTANIDDEENYLELTVAPPPDMAQLLQEERRLEKQLYLKAGLCDSSDTGESRDSGVSENHSRQSSEHYTNSSEENDRHMDSPPHSLKANEVIYQNEALLAAAQTPLLQTVKGNSAESWTESATVAAAATKSLTEATATANAKMLSIEEKIREQEEVLRVERELLQLEQEELKRQRENLMLRENMARRELQHGAKMLLSANRRSLQDLNGASGISVAGLGVGIANGGSGLIYQTAMPQYPLAQHQLSVATAQQPQFNAQLSAQQQIYANVPNLQQQYYQVDIDYRKSMSDLQEFSKRHMLPPTPPTKPMRAPHVTASSNVAVPPPAPLTTNGHDDYISSGQRNSITTQGYGGSLVKIATPTAAPRAPIYSNPHSYQHQSVQNLSSDNSGSTTAQTITNGHAHPGNMSRNTLHALSATPKPKYTDGWVQVQNRKSYDHNNLSNDPAWLSAYQQKRKSMPDAYHAYNNHWLVQEAEQRRIAEQQRRTTSSGNTPVHQQNGNISNGLKPASASGSVSSNGKPLPDSIIQTLTERVQSKGIGERKRFDNYNNNNIGNNLEKSPLHTAAYHQHQPSATLTPAHRHLNELNALNNNSPAPPPQTNVNTSPSHQQQQHPQQQQEKVLSVSGKKKCSHCGDELGRGAAMIIESLLLFYHINCFKCCVCHVQLGDGLNGTDVRVRNHKLHCQNCYSSDDGIKFSCV